MLSETQARILDFIVSRKRSAADTHIGGLYEDGGVYSRSVIEMELRVLAKRGLITVNSEASPMRAALTTNGSEEFDTYALSQNEIDTKEIVELKILVNALQDAVNEINKGNPKDEAIIDKIGKYLSASNNIAAIVKNVSDVWGKITP